MLVSFLLALSAATAHPLARPALLTSAVSWLEQERSESPATPEDVQARLDELRDLLEEARRAEQGRDLAQARALVHRALGILDQTPRIELDEDAVGVVYELGGVAWRAQAVELANAAWARVLAASERTLPEDHPDLLRARGNLALTMQVMGDLPGARALEEAVLEARERTLPEDHPHLLLARGNLAATMRAMGDLPGARALQEAVLEATERSLPEDHPDLLTARGNLAATMSEMGDLPGARALEEAVLAARERTLPEDHPHLLTARNNLAITLAGLESWDEVAEQTAALTRGIAKRLANGLARSSRVAGESARREADRLSSILLFTQSLESAGALALGAFEALETARHVSSAGGVQLEDEEADAELERLRWEASTLRGRLNDLVAAEGGAGEGDGAEDLATLVLERDRIEGRIRTRLLESGEFLERIDIEALAAALPKGGAAVGYRRYIRWRIDREKRHVRHATESLLAHVLRQDGTLQRVELGPISELDELIEAWRSVVGKPLERGVALSEVEDGQEEAAARALSDHVLAPVLAAAGADVETLFICLDDALHLVPLDALPLADGLAGEVLDMRFEVSFARLIQPRESPGSEPQLVALGGASFNAAPRRDDETDEKADAPEATVEATVEASADRAGPGGQMFGPLRQTQFEAENVGVLFEEIFEREPVVMMKKEATKDALEAHSPTARWLHIATHGYFAPESLRSTADLAPADSGLWNPMSAEERTVGLAPMTLCGLALAGANRGRDSLGRVPGILTAEELAGWDLSSCELAVLSACETNVGIRRAGQGVQSLQAALHAAGARASITSLWRVDDEWTRKLMEDLYTRLWVEKEPKAEALWNAKMALRKQGARTRDWAGWVLVGQ